MTGYLFSVFFVSQYPRSVAEASNLERSTGTDKKCPTKVQLSIDEGPRMRNLSNIEKFQSVIVLLYLNITERKKRYDGPTPMPPC